MPYPPSQSYVAPWLYWSLLPIHRAFLGLYFGQIKIEGHEHLPQQGPVVFAPKHFSRWDPLVLALLSTQPLRPMTNANQFTGFQGWLIRQLGAFPVELAHPQLSSLRHTIELLHTGHKLLIFPEGGIVRDQVLRPLKPGLARLVLQAEATAQKPLAIPIVPIALRYEPGAYPGASVFVHVSLPLYTRTYQQENDKQTARVLTQALESALLKGLKATHNFHV